MANINQTIASTFMEIAQGLETGSFGKRPRVAVTGLGSEHGEENVMAGAVLAAKSGVDVVYIGTLEAEGVETVMVSCEADGHNIMEDLLKSGKVDGAVTMHYPFPIGVSTVGRSVTPGAGREMFIATTTGTSAVDRVEGMVRNAVYGIIAAKACGIAEPTVGILNIDGARQAETMLKALKDRGYPINFATSARSDGGCVLRGNDVLLGTPDVMVTDPLTGNVLTKMLSSYTSGGTYEITGYGYGPGIGDGYDRLVMIISRASGSPLIAGAIKYAAQLVQGDVFGVSTAEFAAVKKAGLSQLLEERRAQSKSAPAAEAVTAPPKEVVIGQISGIEIMDIEDAVQCLWKEKIYAESGMGCTGPIVLVSEANEAKATEILKRNSFIK